MSDVEKLRKTIDQLHAELSDMDVADEEVKQLLQSAVSELHEVMEQDQAPAIDSASALPASNSIVARLSEAARVGLETGLAGSINAEIIERAGGVNVADPGDPDVRRGIVNVSMEQVIVANPDTVVTWDPAFYEFVWHEPLWSGIDAVRDGRVYLSPIVPFGWIDRPPSINRIMGLRWLSGVLMPDQMRFDLEEETRSFYRLFYHVDLSDESLAALIESAKGRF